MAPGRARLLAGSQTYALPKSLNGSALTAGALIPGTSNSYDLYQGSYVTPGEKRWSVFSKESQHLTDDLQLHFEGLFTRRNIIRHRCRCISADHVDSVIESVLSQSERRN